MTSLELGTCGGLRFHKPSNRTILSNGHNTCTRKFVKHYPLDHYSISNYSWLSPDIDRTTLDLLSGVNGSPKILRNILHELEYKVWKLTHTIITNVNTHNPISVLVRRRPAIVMDRVYSKGQETHAIYFIIRNT